MSEPKKDAYARALFKLKVQRTLLNAGKTAEPPLDEEVEEPHVPSTGDSHDAHHHPHKERVFYAPPEQRQRWGEAQISPHADWGNLFFDLTYVSAAFNCGALLMSSLTPELWGRGLLYFFGLFGTLYNMFDHKLIYDARYTDFDYVHRASHILDCFLPAYAVSQVVPLNQMADPKNTNMFKFCFAAMFDAIMTIVVFLELYFRGKGNVEAIRNQARGLILYRVLPMLAFYAAAFGIAVNNFVVALQVDYHNETDLHTYDGGHRNLGNFKAILKDLYADDISPGSNNLVEDNYSSGLNESHADDYSSSLTYDDLPIILITISYAFNLIVSGVRRGIILPNSDDFRKYDVPENIDFMVHRYGEWTMLMLGESILSLLIVDTSDSPEYSNIFLFGIITVSLIQTIKFGSEPHDVDDHALWRGLATAYYYNVLVQFFSFALIAYGISFKTGLNKIIRDSAGSYGEDHRALVASFSRQLAEVDASDLTINSLYCGSLSMILLLIELMAGSHRGIAVKARFVSKNPEAALFIIARLAMIVFTATLPIWFEIKSRIVMIGFCVVVAYGLAMLFESLYEGKKNAKVEEESANTKVDTI